MKTADPFLPASLEAIKAAFTKAWTDKFDADLHIAAMNDCPGRKPWELQSDAAEITIEALMDAYGPYLSDQVRGVVAMDYRDRFEALMNSLRESA